MVKETRGSHYPLPHALSLLLFWDEAGKVMCVWLNRGVEQTNVCELACGVKRAVNNPYESLFCFVLFFFTCQCFPLEAQ